VGAEDDWEYPMRVLLGSTSRALPMIAYGTPDNASKGLLRTASYRSLRPCASHPDQRRNLRFAGSVFIRVSSSSLVPVFRVRTPSVSRQLP
jgi:hypothetical protein